MATVSITRLYVLRAAYLFIAVGLAFLVWPVLFSHSSEWALKHGDVFGLLAGVQVLAMVGIRYPLKMIPLLLFELIWKSTWLLAIALPLWRAGQLDAATSESIFACVMGVVISLVAIPWPWVYANYVKAPADPWKPAE